MIKKKNVAFPKYLKKGKTSVNYINMQTSKAELTNAINLSKNKYFKGLGDELNNNKPNNPSTSSKTYWSITKTFVNRKKAPMIIPPWLVNDKLVSNFVEKANIFNDFFGRQCQPLSNDSALPLTFSFETSNWLSNFNIRPEKI